MNNDKGEQVPSKKHLEEGQYLLMAPLDPAKGNLKIRSASEINLEFVSGRQLYSCATTLQKIASGRQILLNFPTNLHLKPQKRTAFRAPVDRNMDIAVTIIRPSGISFAAKFADVSSSGAAFYSTGAIPRLADSSKIEIGVNYPGGRCRLDAMIMGTLTKDGEALFRSQFLIADDKMAKSVTELVSFIQLGNLQRRKETLK